MHGHSNVIEGLFPTWSDIRDDAILWENGGTWSVTRKAQSRTEGHSDMTVRCVLTWSDVSAWPLWCDWGIGSHLIRYKGWFHSLGEWRHLVSYQVTQSRTGGHSDVTIGLVPTWSDIRAISILGMEVPGQLLGKLSLGLRAILMCSHLIRWRAEPFFHG